jgi:hypothetical protein
VYRGGRGRTLAGQALASGLCRSVLLCCNASYSGVMQQQHTGHGTASQSAAQQGTSQCGTARTHVGMQAHTHVDICRPCTLMLSSTATGNMPSMKITKVCPAPRASALVLARSVMASSLPSYLTLRPGQNVNGEAYAKRRERAMGSSHHKCELKSQEHECIHDKTHAPAARTHNAREPHTRGSNPLTPSPHPEATHHARARAPSAGEFKRLGATHRASSHPWGPRRPRRMRPPTLRRHWRRP